jgi:FtsH-binding integral membrane protein
MLEPRSETIYSGPPPVAHPEQLTAPSAQDVERMETDFRSFAVRVFAWITGALLLSAFFASYSDRLDGIEGTVASLVMSQTLWVAIGVMLALAYVVSRRVDNMPMDVAIAVLVAYSAVQGVVFGLLYRGIYGGSLAGVYVCIAALFGLVSLYGAWSKTNVTSAKVLLCATAIAPFVALASKSALSLSLFEICVTCVCSWLLLALVGYHRDFLRDLPASFEDDDSHWDKAAAIGALQIYLDLLVCVILVIQAGWIRDSIESLTRKEVSPKKIDF